jgi:hypothetical protein
MYSALAGFVEPGETTEDAVRREVDHEVIPKNGTVWQRYVCGDSRVNPEISRVRRDADPFVAKYTFYVTNRTTHCSTGRWRASASRNTRIKRVSAATAPIFS